MKSIHETLAELPYERDPYFDKFLYRAYTGCAENGGYKMVHDTSHRDLKPTPVSKGDRCLYCGSKTYPIQAGLTDYRERGMSFGIPDEAYWTTGRYCDCIHAAKYLRIQEEIAAEMDRHRDAMLTLERQLPKENRLIKAMGEMSFDQKDAVKKVIWALKQTAADPSV